MDRMIKYILAVYIMLVSNACTNEPKVVTAQNESGISREGTGIFSGDSSTDGHVHSTASIGEDVHTVIAKKVLQSTKYVYILVQEDNNEFWIATTKQEIKINNSYFYRDGLLKTNFESKEQKRVFDKIYFVSKLVPTDHGNASTASVSPMPVSSKKIDHKGSVKISDLVASPKKYSGKTIQVSGECVKINENIMGRNWIHLNDGSTKNYDLVITSATAVPIGTMFTMTGTVVLGKDFGAGYKYDILLENGIIVQ